MDGLLCANMATSCTCIKWFSDKLWQQHQSVFKTPSSKFCTGCWQPSANRTLISCFARELLSRMEIFHNAAIALIVLYTGSPTISGSISIH